MVNWELHFERHAQRQARRLQDAGLKSKVEDILVNLERNPYYEPPRFEKLVGDLRGLFSRRINLQHRIVYKIDEQNRQVIVHSMFNHYDD